MTQHSQNGEGVEVRRILEMIRDGQRCETCASVFLASDGHPDPKCSYPSWDAATPEERAEWVRQSLTAREPATADVGREALRDQIIGIIGRSYYDNEPGGTARTADAILAALATRPPAQAGAAAGEIPAGMVACDGNGRPADYDGGEVLLRDGSRFTPRSHIVPSWRWHRRNARPESDIIAYTPITTPKASAETGRWRERWYGSEPQKGSAIVDDQGNLIVYLGGDEETHRLTTATVAAHNAALSAAPSAPATEAGEEA